MKLKCFIPATKCDLEELEARLTMILEIIASGDRDRIQALTARLKQSSSALQESIDKQQPRKA